MDIPPAQLTAGRVTSLYDLMDSAYDAPQINVFSCTLGHVPMIDPNPRGGRLVSAICSNAGAKALRLEAVGTVAIGILACRRAAASSPAEKARVNPSAQDHP